MGMNKISKISTYGLILYLALMICCVQSTYLHHAMHHIMSSSGSGHQAHSSELVQNTLIPVNQNETESTLFKNIFSLSILSGLLVIFILLFQNIVLPLNTLLIYIKRHKFKRRWRNLRLTSSFGLRSPPAYQ